MKRIFILLILSIFLLAGCSQDTAAREKVKINLPGDNTVNGYVSSGKSAVNGTMPEVISAAEVAVGGSIESQSTNSAAEYYGNKNSKVFHRASCSSVKNMKDENKVSLKSRDEFIAEGYKPCGKCAP